MASFRTLTVIGCLTPAIALAIWQGCFVYDESLLIASDAATDAGSDANTQPDVGDGCNHSRWPARPTIESDSSTDTIEFYNALEILDFGAGEAGVVPVGTPIGFDLDDICTCPGPDSCNVFDAGTQCDLDGGVDNSLGQLVQEFSGSANFFDEGYINMGIGQGVFGALFRVKNYNGQANDEQVELSIYMSNGTQNGAIPKWDGTDQWTIDPSSLLGGTIQGEPAPNVAYDLNAYVTNYMLVGNISDMPLAIGAADGEGLVTIDMTGAVVAAKLTPFGNTFQATGFVAGRWETKKLLTSLQVLHDPLDFDASLCGSDTVYQLLKTRICVLQDIATNVLDDGKNAPCDALSLAFAFKSIPATYGSVVPKPDAGGGCGASWTDQCGN